VVGDVTNTEKSAFNMGVRAERMVWRGTRCFRFGCVGFEKNLQRIETLHVCSECKARLKGAKFQTHTNSKKPSFRGCGIDEKHGVVALVNVRDGNMQRGFRHRLDVFLEGALRNETKSSKQIPPDRHAANPQTLQM
jgi:hypothetical protein